MGTRYSVKPAQFAKAGLAIMFYPERRVAHLTDDGEFVENVIPAFSQIGIAGWAFTSYTGSEFLGPNIGKPEVNQTLLDLGVEWGWN